MRTAAKRTPYLALSCVSPGVKGGGANGDMLGIGEYWSAAGPHDAPGLWPAAEAEHRRHIITALS